MKKNSRIPKINSIQQVARFWDKHDLTDFEGDLNEVNRPVFARRGTRAIQVPLKAREARTLKNMADAKGLSPQELVRSWVVKKLDGRKSNRAA